MASEALMVFPAVWLLAAPAWSYESDPQPLVISDSAVLYTGSNVDTDWLPSGSPISVRFQIVSEGGASVDMEGTGNLTWPDALTLGFDGTPGSGLFVVDAALAAVTSVRFDLFGYSYESELDRRTVGAGGEATFDPFLLSGASTPSVSVETAGDSTELITYELEVFAGVSLNFEATLTPTGTTRLSGVAFWADDDTGTTEITEEGGTALITPTGAPSQSVLATFIGQWDSTLDLDITPAVSVCFPIYGCEELASFDIPLNLATDSFEQAAPAVDLEFPLPVLETEAASYDMGEVLVGSIANLNLPIGDAGLLPLEGDIGVTGSPYFTVFPGYFYAGSGEEDGAVVTFAPESAGEFTATLLLTSNDPNAPVYEVEITGTGVDPEQGEEADTGGPQDEGAEGKVRTCGCASSPEAAGRGVAGIWAFVAVGAALARRRGVGSLG